MLVQEFVVIGGQTVYKIALLKELGAVVRERFQSAAGGRHWEKRE
jgi:hypothetical protein